MFDARNRSFTKALLLSGALTLVGGVAYAQTPQPAAPPAQPTAAPAAEAQVAATPDDVLVAKIRKAIKDDKAIAIYGDSIKVIASSGTVSLKGPVRTDAEKKAIGAKADAIAGEANVMNNLMVNPDHAELPKPPTN